MGRPQFQKHKKNSPPVEGFQAQKKKSQSAGESPRRICFSFKDFDRNQGQSYADWAETNLLLKMVEMIANLTTMTRQEAVGKQCLTIYGDFPDKSGVKTAFTHPKHVSEDAHWCRLKLQNLERIVGHIDQDDVFHVVFLDKAHQFWPSER